MRVTIIKTARLIDAINISLTTNLYSLHLTLENCNFFFPFKNVAHLVECHYLSGRNYEKIAEYRWDFMLAGGRYEKLLDTDQ